MASMDIATHRVGAEIYYDATLCKQKAQELLHKFRLPKTFMPFTNLVEVGFNPTTGFIWLKQQKPTKYRVKDIGVSSYASEMTGFLEDGRMRKLTEQTETKQEISEMESKDIATHRAGAEIYYGATLCKQKAQELLDKFRLPKMFMPFNNLVEVGFNPTTGFIWLKQQKPTKYRVKDIGVSSYAIEMTGFLEDRRMRKLTGIKSKEMMIWITLSDISIDQTDPSKIIFTTSMKLSKSFPVVAFEAEPEEIN
ncbi:hypothetical protein V6N13_026402 [Hibiscus sabdariffa]